MKIGIITFWNSSDNYGQLLQCFALQQQLKRMGHDPFLIKYSSCSKTSSPLSVKIRKFILIYPIIKTIKSRIENIRDKRIAKLLAIKNKQRDFNSFRKKYIISEEKVYHNLNEIQKTPPQAECYICGSDQIWGLLLNNPDHRAYLLDFGNDDICRIAYAASFGINTYPTKLKPILHSLLSKLDALSVREDSGVSICEDLGLRAYKALDPTLLLSKEDYLSIAELPLRQNYFYTYSINIPSAKGIYWDKLMDYAKELQLESISTNSSGYIPGREICPNTQYVYATIPQWLGYISKAKFVATTSFHGVAFCLILKKNFIYFPLKGEYSQGNNRVQSLLYSVGLTEKICTEENSVKKCIEYPINWDEVEKRLELMRNGSVEFLNSNLLKKRQS